ncbi:MAG: tRNA (adenosine(37)-N6)-threonylcarbamoyltransferase complex dimerization subunit type 1 TsaB [Acidobacteriota bacterium]|nr:tRNA (adenosine(37)-N6)-threonylcarbamoyltransferase complex dimerization subunit type 1 TsaB [Acidobacteriota bacterium]
MLSQYSDSPLLVAVDSASPITSVAVGFVELRDGSRPGDSLLGTRQTPSGRSSTDLLVLLDDILSEHQLSPRNIERLVGNRGPGSFTGLRIGMATLMGLAQSLDAQATAATAFRALAAQVGMSTRDDDHRTVALIDALRGEWFAQTFDPGGLKLTEAEIVEPEKLLDWAPCRIVGFGLQRLPAALSDHPGVEIQEAVLMAPTLLELGRHPGLEWDAGLLTTPLYLRAPAATTNPR